jgi:hypothetical protein
MKFSTRSFALAAMCSATLFLFYACKKSVQDTTGSRASSGTSSQIEGDLCGFPQTEPLTAGQTIPAGSMTIANDGDYLYVTYNTTDGWKIKELHLSVDCRAEGAECTVAKSSDVAPGKFPYSAVFTATGTAEGGTEGLPTTYKFTIPRTALSNCECFCVFPHASVVKYTEGVEGLNSQTAWGGSIQRIVNGGKWYGGTNYCMQECDLGK